jgi:hypothetical protein
MSEKTELLEVSAETMRFMRGRYALDEIGNGVDELTFRENDEVIFTIRVYDGHYDFHIDDQCVSVADLETLDAAKTLILNRKKPNRKPFPKENAIYADCGHRCDLCLHYTGGAFSEEFRMEIGKRIIRAYNITPANSESTDPKRKHQEAFPPCDGCRKGGIGGNFGCEQMKCSAQNGADKCVNCVKYPCDKALVGLHPEIHTRTIFADDVTWAILPFVHEQYGN